MDKIKVFRIRLVSNYLEEDEILVNDFLESVEVISVKANLVPQRQDPFWSIIVHYRPLEEHLTNDHIRIQYDSAEPLSPDEDDLFFAIKIWRDKEAEKLHIIPSMIIHDAHIRTLIKLRVTSIEDFQRVRGLSARKIEKYGDRILEILQKHIPNLDM